GLDPKQEKVDTGPTVLGDTRKKTKIYGRRRRRQRRSRKETQREEREDLNVEGYL
ncbi:Hypothetical predicted protein, partial [Pelobates cultripes]